jgi:hypothetical protein
MDSLELAARFAAFTWYTNSRQAPRRTTQAEAKRFSNQSWKKFLPVADKGWGRLLARIANPRPDLQHKPIAESQQTKRQLARCP